MVNFIFRRFGIVKLLETVSNCDNECFSGETFEKSNLILITTYNFTKFEVVESLYKFSDQLDHMNAL